MTTMTRRTIIRAGAVLASIVPLGIANALTIAVPPATPLSSWDAYRIVDTAFALRPPSLSHDDDVRNRGERNIYAMLVAIVSLRDNGHREIDPSSLFGRLTLDNAIAMANDPRITGEASMVLGRALANTPSYDPRKGGNQDQATRYQFDYPVGVVCKQTLDRAIPFLADPANVGSRIDVPGNGLVRIVWPDGSVVMEERWDEADCRTLKIMCSTPPDGWEWGKAGLRLRRDLLA